MSRAVTLWIVLCGTVALAQTPAAQPGGGEAAVRQVSDNFVKAMNAGDAKAVAIMYGEDGIEMPPNQPMVKGRTAIEAYYQKMFTGPMKMTSFTLDHIDTRTSGDLAYDLGTYRVSLAPSDGAAINETGKYVVIAKQTAGDWKIAYVIYNSDQPPAPPMK